MNFQIKGFLSFFDPPYHVTQRNYNFCANLNH